MSLTIKYTATIPKEYRSDMEAFITCIGQIMHGVTATYEARTVGNVSFIDYTLVCETRNLAEKAHEKIDEAVDIYTGVG